MVLPEGISDTNCPYSSFYRSRPCRDCDGGGNFAKKPHSKRKKRQQRAFHRDMPGNKSVYKYGRKVHIEYLHGVTLCEVTAK
ncbi:putative uncharacterized protein [Klebsiella pneumoniae]|nr:putative uncharacterized protein [Klebsiella pneumoniae]